MVKTKPWYTRWWAILALVTIFLMFSLFVLGIFLVGAGLLLTDTGGGNRINDAGSPADTGSPSPVVVPSLSFKTSDFLSSLINFTEPRITTTIRECGFANAFYSPSTLEIVMCEELASELGRLFYPEVTRLYGNDTDRRLKEKISNALWFIYAHERGHALIHAYNIPITGREEDVADQIAFVYARPDNMILDTSLWFLQRAAEGDINNLPYYDEHGLDKQRYYNLLCWLYGTDTEKYSYLFTEGYLPQERAERCPYESYQVRQGVAQLIDTMNKNAGQS